MIYRHPQAHVFLAGQHGAVGLAAPCGGDSFGLAFGAEFEFVFGGGGQDGELSRQWEAERAQAAAEATAAGAAASATHALAERDKETARAAELAATNKSSPRRTRS
ncbi:MAG: hypothetical protein JWN52_4651 [Actinomycetia bacterium]|nr:hypothetical protein [Actinomycetes bacterium]